MAKKFNLADYVQPVDVSESDTDGAVRLLPIERLRGNTRNFYSLDGLDDLADSIALNGLLHPLAVYPGSGILYTVLSGHRRLRALEILRRRPGHEHDYDMVPCTVRARPADTAHEDLMLIHANSTGRVRSPGEMAEEQKRLTAALVALKKEGVELPGRLRDAVADAMGVSSSKLGRIQAIENNLCVPGFKQAWKDGKLPEAAAYELSQLNEGDQYTALDLLIDEGVNYEKADIKAVQRVKKRVALGESPAQDLAAQAEKLGIEIREGDYSPLFAYYVRDAVPGNVQRDLRGLTKAQALERLHRYGFGHACQSGPGYYYVSDPNGLTIKEPIGKRIKWSEVWELLAMSALAASAGGASPSPTETTGGGAAPDPMKAPTVTVSWAPWRSCLNDPPEGWTLAFLLSTWDVDAHDYDLQIAQFHDGKWWGIYDASSEEIETDLFTWWCPAPAIQAEVWEGAEGDET